MKATKVVAYQSTISHTVKCLLILHGIWPDTSCITLCKVFWSVSLTIIQFWHYKYLLAHFYSNDIFDLMDCLSTFIGYFKLLIKIIVFWWNQQIFNQILRTMAEDWKECATNDIEMRKIISKAKISHHISNAIVTLHTVTVLFYGTNIILTDVDITDRTVEIPHLIRIELPFDIKTQNMYTFVLIIEVIQLLMSSLGTAMVNALLIALTLHIGGQIDILHCWLTELEFVQSADIYRINVIKKIIQKHQKIIYFTENIEALYIFIALLQFVSNVIMICILGFLVITALDNPNATEKIMRSLSYYSVTNLEAFIFCYAGEYLINKSKAIGYAAYDSAWYNMEPKDRRILLLIILRSQKQLTLTIGKLMDLSLQRFTSIMNSAGSYISVLMAMQ
ncbi:odorant receptor 4-like [Harpegnathos saltator]|uniref:odorant receptor 4-like n=1 Tax=Harpegnathos saltator TaxID=610380 RepID=UPI000DBEE868|nr:odorant receptor 4-like [Harpegnathos saltator]